MSELVRINQNNGLPPKIVKSRKRKPMPAEPHGEVLFENVNDYIAIVDGRRIMFDKLTNLEVNKCNWPRIEASRCFNK